MWFQRSRALWATHGDKNSKYFHNRATQQFRKNKIDGIRDEAGQWRLDPKIVAFMMLEFYSNLFSSFNSVQPELTLELVQTTMTEDMNRQLLAEFSKGEVKLALNRMAPLKAFGLDGMPPLFYQHYWDLVGKEITTSVISFLNWLLFLSI